MTDSTKVTLSESCSIAYDALTSVHELTDTLQIYLLESGSIDLEAKHDSVISALTERIKSECTGAQEVVRFICAE